MSEQQFHVVVVDDEEEIRKTLDEYLSLHGYRVSCAANGVELRNLAEQETFDLAILDITMPGEDGLSLARFLRDQTDIGIVMLTASGDVVDRIIGLEMGADDYLAKPVNLRELLARLKAVVRRTKSRTGAIYGDDGTLKETAFGECRLNLESHKLFGADGNEIPITSMEYDLLKAFAERPDQVLDRDLLLDLAHKRDWEPFDRSIDIRIARIRRKIEQDPKKPQIIKTVRGTGYVFSPNK